jgi:multisubunit Na+/H+ antiporter MnhB subunit
MKKEKQNSDAQQTPPPVPSSQGMTVVVKTVSSWLKVLIFLFGIYIILSGDLGPGGGFAGGVILALSYVLLMLAFGREFAEKNLPRTLAARLYYCGALTFAIIAILGIPFGGAFLSNFLIGKFGEPLTLLGGGTLPLSNIAIAFNVGASLYLVILSLSVCCKGKECKFE